MPAGKDWWAGHSRSHRPYLMIGVGAGTRIGRTTPLGRGGSATTSRLAPVLVLLAGTLVFVTVTEGYFISDDFAYVSEFRGFSLADLALLFTGDWSMGIWGANIYEYRPLWGLSFIADLWVWGVNPRGLHLTNIGLHAAAANVVWLLAASAARAAGLANKFGLAAGLALAFFVVAPVHEQPVVWIAARGHIMVTIFIIGSMLLLRRFEQHGSRLTYCASIGAAIAAFATMELALALPGLLLLGDLLDGQRLNRPRLWRLAWVHAPFWCLLAAYLGYRMVIFGALSPPGSAEPVSGTAASVSSLVDSISPTPLAGKAVREVLRVLTTTVDLWISPTPIQDSPMPLVLLGAGALVLLLAWPLLVLRGEGLHGYARQIVFFAICWPVLTTAPLLGQHAQRHFYLASVGLCVALGLAAAHLVGSRTLQNRLAAGLVACVLAGHTLSLVGGIAASARNGQQSWALHNQLAAVLQRSEGQHATIVVLPEMPTRRWLWEYSLPFAARSLFTDRTSLAELIPSREAYCCPDWDATFGQAVAHLSSDSTEPIYLIRWDPEIAAFGTRVLTHAEFRQAGYTLPGGPLALATIP